MIQAWYLFNCHSEWNLTKITPAPPQSAQKLTVTRDEITEVEIFYGKRDVMKLKYFSKTVLHMSAIYSIDLLLLLDNSINH
jgi:hypothetical protein